ncbi:MAG: DNA methyltransferase [Patescibacteria group bacterium]|jgi:tRNA G10  N-methylase Trm11
MNRYCFILGKNPILSISEIFNLEKNQKLNFAVVDLTSKGLVIDAGESFDPQIWQNQLGGCIKIGAIVSEINNVKRLFDIVNADFLKKNILSQKDKKQSFGFSLYGDVLWRYQTEFNAHGLRLKKELQKSNFKCRFVAAQGGDLSSVQITKNKMIENGADIIIISGLHSFYIGKTISVQDFEDYSFRDYGRPQRDAASGMLPPKLAKMMINLSQISSGQLLLDPFCGSGTVLQEAMLMGYKNIAGSDISDRAIDDTKNNMEWLAKEYDLPKSNLKLHMTDVKEIYKFFPPNSVDAIVTEPFLGPPLKKNIGVISVLAVIQELESLYLSAFYNFAKITKPTATIIMVFPLYRTPHGIYSLKILEQLEKMGFYRINPIPNKVSLFAKIGPTARGSIIYNRPDQNIEREIFIFKRIKPKY